MLWIAADPIIHLLLVPFSESSPSLSFLVLIRSPINNIERRCQSKEYKGNVTWLGECVQELLVRFRLKQAPNTANHADRLHQYEDAEPNSCHHYCVVPYLRRECERQQTEEEMLVSE